MRVLHLLSLTLALCACEVNGTPNPNLPSPSQPSPNLPSPNLPSPNIMQGVVLDSSGIPLEGAEVFAGHTVYYNTNSLTISDAQGRYRTSVSAPAGSWTVGGSVSRTYHGRTLRFDLHPLNSAPFVGAQGAVRDLEWRLSGPRPSGGFYGGTVTVYPDFFDPELLGFLNTVTLRLEPDGPLVDGSAGQTLERRMGSTPEGDGLSDVPVGRYRVRATYAPDGARQPLRLRPRNTGDYADQVSVTFRQNGSGHLLELEVSRQP